MRIYLLPLIFSSLPVYAQQAPEWKSNVGFSALLSTGNSSNQTFGGNGLLSYKWDSNKLESTAVGAYGRSDVSGVSTVNTNNWKATERYDRYITEPVSLFGFAHFGQDPPAGYDSRYGGAGGLAHEIVKTDPNYFKYELGFDYTHENLVAAPDNNIYSARTYLLYKRQFSKDVSFGQDVESLFDFEHGKNVRLNTFTNVTAKLIDKVAFQFGFKVGFDNVPAPGKKKTDTTTQAGLVVTLL